MDVKFLVGLIKVAAGSQEVKDYLHAQGKIASANVVSVSEMIAIAQLICQGAGIVCPIINQL